MKLRITTALPALLGGLLAGATSTRAHEHLAAGANSTTPGSPLIFVNAADYAAARPALTKISGEPGVVELAPAARCSCALVLVAPASSPPNSAGSAVVILSFMLIPLISERLFVAFNSRRLAFGSVFIFPVRSHKACGRRAPAEP